MEKYNQTRSFNVGIAEETSVVAALIYDDLSYAQQMAGKDNWFYRTYEKLMARLPYSERTLRNGIEKLVEAGWVEKRIAKVKGKPTTHYHVIKSLSAKTAETMESAKIAETSIYKTTNKTTNKNTHSEKDESTKEMLEEIIALVNPRERVTDVKIRNLSARLKEYSFGEIKAAARAFSQSEWHKQNGQMHIKNLLAPTKFDRWFDEGAKLTEEDKLAGKPITEMTAEERIAQSAKENQELEEFRKQWGDEDAPQ